MPQTTYVKAPETCQEPHSILERLINSEESQEKRVGEWRVHWRRIERVRLPWVKSPRNTEQVQKFSLSHFSQTDVFLPNIFPINKIVYFIKISKSQRT